MSTDAHTGTALMYMPIPKNLSENGEVVLLFALYVEDQWLRQVQTHREEEWDIFSYEGKFDL